MVTQNTALVTGATGFIGGRLVEKLVERGTRVRALVKNFGNASRISRFRLDMCPGEITDAAALDQAVRGSDVVFHCAHDFSDPRHNIEGARLLADACVRQGVRRLVHVSSISVYEPLPDGDLDEQSASEPCGWTYPDNKLAVEEFLLGQSREGGVPTVVLQPTIVYGPFSRPWTLAPVSKLRNGRVVLPSDRDGLCSAVYIDDVVDALLLAAERDAAVGERFLISGPDSVTWNDFYGAYEEMLGTRSRVWMTTREIEALNSRREVKSTLWLVAQDPRRLLEWPVVRRLYEKVRSRFISERMATKAKQTLPSSLYVPNEVQLALYTARVNVKIDKARKRLGYQPAFTFRRGMELTARFVAWANL